MLYAVSPRGVGKPVGVRAINKDWPLADGETFTVTDWDVDYVLADDGVSLRKATDSERDEMAKNLIHRDQFRARGLTYKEPVLTLDDKLARLGLTKEELKELLK